MNRIVLVLTVIVLIALTACEKDKNEVSFLETVNLETNTDKENITSIENKIIVYVSGEVKNPGIYQLYQDSRLYEAIEQAGGMTNNAKTGYLNLAEKLTDGQQIQVLSKSQYKKMSKEQNIIKETDGHGTGALININTATSEELTTLPGIGETKAAAIISYRDINGGFASIEDIKNVSGIGEATYSQFEKLITVK